jgi:uncharacterized protein (TIGR02284 family)
MSDQKMKEKANSLIEKNNDAAKGYQKAAKHVESASLKDFLSKQSKQRKAFADDLSIKLRAYYPDVETDNDGSVSGSLHRSWLSVKAVLSLDSDESVLEECLRGDKKEKEEYEEFLSLYAMDTNEVSKLVSKQKIKLEETLQTIKSLEDLK